MTLERVRTAFLLLALAVSMTIHHVDRKAIGNLQAANLRLLRESQELMEADARLKASDDELKAQARQLLARCNSIAAQTHALLPHIFKSSYH
jgi:uncharacterized protein (DUF885 family)